MKYRFEIYSTENQKEWDDFVEHQSINGTLLHTQRFLEYHPKGRFENLFFMIYNKKNNLVGLCPGAIIEKEGEKEFFSYSGATFGGLIISKKVYNFSNILEILQELITILKGYDLRRIYMKQTSRIFTKDNSDDIFEYVYKYLNFKEYVELSTYIELTKYRDSILDKFTQGKRTNVNNCIKADMRFRELIEREEIETFYDILKDNLKKYDVEPVHTIGELLDLKLRLKGDCQFFGIFLEHTIIAGTFVFSFNNRTILHTQYLAADAEYNKLSPMTFLCYKLIEYSVKNNYQILSWGISTENRGEKVNIGLLKSKESFGSEYCNNKSYELIL